MRIIYTNQNTHFVPTRVRGMNKSERKALAATRAADAAKAARAAAKVDLNSPAQVAARKAFLATLRKA